MRPEKYGQRSSQGQKPNPFLGLMPGLKTLAPKEKADAVQGNPRCRPEGAAAIQEGQMISRRKFLNQGAVGAAGLLLAPKISWQAADSRAADSRIEVLFDEPLGTISPNIYGHFTENLERSSLRRNLGGRAIARCRISMAFAKNSSTKCGRSKLRWCAFPADASPTATTGATALDQPTNGRGGPTSGTAANEGRARESSLRSQRIRHQ